MRSFVSRVGTMTSPPPCCIHKIIHSFFPPPIYIHPFILPCYKIIPRCNGDRLCHGEMADSWFLGVEWFGIIHRNPSPLPFLARDNRVVGSSEAEQLSSEPQQWHLSFSNDGPFQTPSGVKKTCMLLLSPQEYDLQQPMLLSCLRIFCPD